MPELEEGDYSRGWQERMTEKIREQGHGDRHKRTYWGSILRVRVHEDFMRYVHAAAQMHDMTIGSYIRRSVAKQLAKDFALDWRKFLVYTPLPAPYNSAGPKNAEGRQRGRVGEGRGLQLLTDDGTGFGDWT